MLSPSPPLCSPPLLALPRYTRLPRANAQKQEKALELASSSSQRHARKASNYWIKEQHHDRRTSNANRQLHEVCWHRAWPIFCFAVNLFKCVQFRDGTCNCQTTSKCTDFELGYKYPRKINAHRTLNLDNKFVVTCDMLIHSHVPDTRWCLVWLNGKFWMGMVNLSFCRIITHESESKSECEMPTVILTRRARCNAGTICSWWAKASATCTYRSRTIFSNASRTTATYSELRDRKWNGRQEE